MTTGPAGPRDERESEEPIGCWEGLSTAELARRWGSPAVHAFARLGSTNDVARRLAAAGAPPGTVVLAEEQLAGRGRVGRGWDSPPGLGLWFSLVIRPAALPEPGALPLVAGLALARALDGLVGPGAVRLKWPNDLVVNGRKLGGILCESVWEGSAPSFVAVGIGINVLHLPGGFPLALRERATSVRIAAGRDLERLEVASAVIPAAVERLTGAPTLDAGALAEIEARDLLRGRGITVTEPSTGAPLCRGVALGVAPDGCLLVREEAGAVRRLHSGTARLDGEAA